MTPRRVDGGGDTRFLYAGFVFVTLAVICLALILLSGCSLKSQQIGFASVQAADLASTHYAESQGAREFNPVMATGWPQRIVLKSASVITVVYVTQYLAKKGHKRFARGLLYAVNGLMVGIVANNFRVARGMR